MFLYRNLQFKVRYISDRYRQYDVVGGENGMWSVVQWKTKTID